MKPEAFSMLSCYHLGNSHVMLSMEAAGLHLKSAEGFGLSASDVAKVTKILLLALTSMDVLAKMCAAFSMLLALTLGEKAPATTAFLQQCNDFHHNEESYHMRAMADATFPLQVAIYLDWCFQLYLGDCVHAAILEEVDKKWLSFHSMWKEIMLGTFQVQHVPALLFDQLPSLWSGHDKHHGHHLQGNGYDDNDASPLQARQQKKQHMKGRPISNDDIVLSWKVDKGHLGFFVAQL